MPEQRRLHLRLPIESTSFIALPSSRQGQAQSGRMLTCKTMNVYCGGLHVILDANDTDIERWGALIAAMEG